MLFPKAMKRVAVIVSGAVTVTVKLHESARAAASVTVQTTVETPSRKFDPLAGAQLVRNGGSPATTCGVVDHGRGIAVGGCHPHRAGAHENRAESLRRRRTVVAASNGDRCGQKDEKTAPRKDDQRRKLNPNDSITAHVPLAPSGGEAPVFRRGGRRGMWRGRVVGFVGALSFVDVDKSAPYVGILPSFVWLAALVVAGAICVVAFRPPTSAVAPLWLSAVAILPWLPLPLPWSAFIWTGNVLLWLWAAIAVALVAPVITRRLSLVTIPPLRQSALLAGVVGAVFYGLVTWSVAPAHPKTATNPTIS